MRRRRWNWKTRLVGRERGGGRRGTGRRRRRRGRRKRRGRRIRGNAEARDTSIKYVKERKRAHSIT